MYVSTTLCSINFSISCNRAKKREREKNDAFTLSPEIWQKYIWNCCVQLQKKPSINLFIYTIDAMHGHSKPDFSLWGHIIGRQHEITILIFIDQLCNLMQVYFLKRERKKAPQNSSNNAIFIQYYTRTIKFSWTGFFTILTCSPIGEDVLTVSNRVLFCEASITKVLHFSCLFLACSSSSIDNKTILERDFIHVWTKAAIKPSDLEKKVRRESKGSVAIKEKRERRLALKDPKVRTKAGSIIKQAYTALRSLGFSDKEVLLMAKKEVAKHQVDHKHK